MYKNVDINRKELKAGQKVVYAHGGLAGKVTLRKGIVSRVNPKSINVVKGRAPTLIMRTKTKVLIIEDCLV